MGETQKLNLYFRVPCKTRKPLNGPLLRLQQSLHDSLLPNPNPNPNPHPNGQCPNELRDPGGCNNPCTVFKNDHYCCTSTSTSGSCKATVYSMFFKDMCPDAYSYPKDDATSTFTCPSASNYRLVFLPLN